jgi:hypothetical protein
MEDAVAEDRKSKDQSPGRRANAALPLGERAGDDTPEKVKAQGRRERRTAGPDGPDARAVGDTFKRPPAR